MSEGIIIALITAGGSIIGGIIGRLISSSALVKAARIKKDGESSNKEEKSFSWGGIGMGVIIGAILMPLALSLLGFFPAQHSDIDAISGTWVGTAKNGESEFDVRFVIGKACELGQVCGTFEFPSMPFSGTVTITRISGTVYEFKANDLSNGAVNSPDIQDSLQLLPDGTLLYVSSGGSYGEARGVLHKSK